MKQSRFLIFIIIAIFPILLMSQSLTQSDGFINSYGILHVTGVNGTPGPFLPLSGGTVSGSLVLNNGVNSVWNTGQPNIGGTPIYSTNIPLVLVDGTQATHGQFSIFSQGLGYWNIINSDSSGNMESRIAFGNDATISMSESSGSSIVLGGSGGGISGYGYNFLRVSKSEGPGGQSDGVQIGDDNGANLSIVQGEVYVNGAQSAPTNQAFYVVSNNSGNTFSVDPNNDIVSMIKLSSDSGAFTSDGSGNLTANSYTGAAYHGGSGSFSSLAASSTVSGTGFSTYLASPPAIGGTAPSTGKFTSLIINGGIKNAAAQTVVNCSTSGTATFSQPEQGSSWKRVVIYAAACLGTASYTYPVAFTNTPVCPTTTGLSCTLLTSIGTTSATFTGTTNTGFDFIDGY